MGPYRLGWVVFVVAAVVLSWNLWSTGIAAATSIQQYVAMEFLRGGAWLEYVLLHW